MNAFQAAGVTAQQEDRIKAALVAIPHLNPACILAAFLGWLRHRDLWQLAQDLFACVMATGRYSLTDVLTCLWGFILDVRDNGMSFEAIIRFLECIGGISPDPDPPPPPPDGDVPEFKPNPVDRCG